MRSGMGEVSFASELTLGVGRSANARSDATRHVMDQSKAACQQLYSSCNGRAWAWDADDPPDELDSIDITSASSAEAQADGPCSSLPAPSSFAYCLPSLSPQSYIQALSATHPDVFPSPPCDVVASFAQRRQRGRAHPASISLPQEVPRQPPVHGRTRCHVVLRPGCGWDC